MDRDYYLKYKNDQWWAVVGHSHPGLDPDANDASVTFIIHLTEAEAYYLREVANRLIAACWTPNQSPEDRQWNKYVIDECLAILSRYEDR